MKIPSSARNRTVVALALLSTAFTAPVMAQSFTDFESFTTGVSVDGQDGWRASNPNWDEEVVQLSGNVAWRVSNAVTSSSFGEQPFAKPSGLFAGETGSTHIYSGNSAVTDTFYASFDIWPVIAGPQPGLDITISPDDGQGSRQSFLSIEDNGNGIDIDFYDTDANHPVNNQNGGFRLTEITGLSYGLHNIAFEITFVDGNVIDPDGTVHGNDIVNLYVDGNLVHTGTTWESYFWTTTEGQTEPSIRAIDTLLFRLSTPGFSSDGPGGFYIDNVQIGSEAPQPGPENAYFNVTKTFGDGNTETVDVTLICDAGYPLSQTTTIAGGDPSGVTFVLTNIPEAGADCEVSESGGPAGYTPEFNGGEGCSWADVTGGEFTCEIFNQPGPATLTISTEWLVSHGFDSPVDMTANIQLRCSMPFDGASQDGDYYQDYALQGETASVEVTGIGTDLPGNDKWCYVVNNTEMGSGLEVENGCGTEADPIVFNTGNQVSCLISYTIFFEGIPSLNQYGLAVLSLLMLGMGFVGIRRFV